jgi:hypothetical protein
MVLRGGSEVIKVRWRGGPKTVHVHNDGAATKQMFLAVVECRAGFVMCVNRGFGGCELVSQWRDVLIVH